MSAKSVFQMSVYSLSEILICVDLVVQMDM